MEPNAGPNWTQTAPWNSQHGIWMNLNKSSQSDLQHWRVIWSLTLNPSGFEGVVLANSMLVTFGRPNFSLRIVLTLKKNYSGSRSVGGKSWNQNTSKKRPWLIFRYVLGSVFVAQPSKVSCNRQKTWHGAQLHRGKPQRGNNGGNTTGRPHRENEKCHVYGG